MGRSSSRLCGSTEDDTFGPGRVRKDGRKVRRTYFFKVRSPAESRGLRN